MSSEAQVRDLLQQALSPDTLIVKDVSDGCGAKFDVVVVSRQFDGVPLVERHRMVQSGLGDTMRAIHALSIKAWTAEQWQAKRKLYE